MQNIINGAYRYDVRLSLNTQVFKNDRRPNQSDCFKRRDIDMRLFFVVKTKHIPGVFNTSVLSNIFRFVSYTTNYMRETNYIYVDDYISSLSIFSSLCPDTHTTRIDGSYAWESLSLFWRLILF